MIAGVSDRKLAFFGEKGQNREVIYRYYRCKDF